MSFNTFDPVSYKPKHCINCGSEYIERISGLVRCQMCGITFDYEIKEIEQDNLIEKSCRNCKYFNYFGSQFPCCDCYDSDGLNMWEFGGEL